MARYASWLSEIRIRAETGRAARSCKGRTACDSRRTEEARRAEKAARGGARTRRVRQKIQRCRPRETAREGRQTAARRNTKIPLRRHGDDVDRGIGGRVR